MLTAPSQCTNELSRQRTKENYVGIPNSGCMICVWVWWMWCTSRSGVMTV